MLTKLLTYWIAMLLFLILLELYSPPSMKALLVSIVVFIVAVVTGNVTAQALWERKKRWKE